MPNELNKPLKGHKHSCETADLAMPPLVSLYHSLNPFPPPSRTSFLDWYLWNICYSLWNILFVEYIICGIYLLVESFSQLQCKAEMSVVCILFRQCPIKNAILSK